MSKPITSTYDHGERLTHDSFGLIALTTVRGNSLPLFGSDIRHHQAVTISVYRAHLDRHLSKDWIHRDSHTPLIEFRMSHAQFAQFLTSSGNGEGTPVTLNYAEGRNTEVLEALESKQDIFRNEISETAKKYTQDLEAEIARLGGLIESGKAPKAELRSIHNQLKIKTKNLPRNMEFVVESAKEALENATVHAKIEIEAYVENATKRIPERIEVPKTLMIKRTTGLEKP